ncbi:MAG: peptidyl-prolyl cis-trans isomerase [Bacteroidota bacterium]
MKTFAIGLLLLAGVIAGGCNRQPPDEKIIARVGTMRLTMDDARHSIDTSQGPFENQLPGYISLWVTNTLLYQEAQREGIDNTDLFRGQIEETRRQIAIQDLLQKNIYADTAGINEQALRSYFSQHGNEFFVTEDMIKLNTINFVSREGAGTFAASVVQARSWDAALAKARSSMTLSPEIVSVAENQYFSQRTAFPPELWKVASTLDAGEVSFPVKTNLGYFIIQLLSVLPQGKKAEFDLVRDEVKNRYLIEQRRMRYEQYLGTLRKRYDVEILVNAGKIQDTTQVHPHE